MRRNTLFWGLVLILLGIIFLLDNMGVFKNVNIWGIIWPGFLILFGIWILFGHRLRGPSGVEHAVVPLDGAQSAQIRMNHWAGRLYVKSGASAENLIEGDFTEGVEVKQHLTGDRMDVTLSVPGNFFPFPFSWGFNGLDWHVAINQSVPITLRLGSGAEEARLDLVDLQVSEIIVETGASSTHINLPENAGYTHFKVSSGASSTVITVPQGVAARIRTSSGLASINVARNRFPKSGSGYQSSEYDTAQNKVDIEIETGVGSVDIR